MQKQSTLPPLSNLKKPINLIQNILIMNRLDKLFQEKKQDILNIYFTAGYPNLEDTATLINALTQAGADLIEVGMPYSDPLADGTTIQQSSTHALQNGMTLQKLFEQIKQARQKTAIPLILMGYFNQVMQFGEERFLAACAEAGVDGLILPDLPLGVFERHFKNLLEKYNLRISFLITPQTEEERIKKIADLTTGFIYVVSSYAITGGTSGISAEQIAYFKRIEKMNLPRPRLIGFGITNRETFEIACQYAQGAIIGSAFIRALEGLPSEKVASRAKNFVKSILPISIA